MKHPVLSTMSALVCLGLGALAGCSTSTPEVPADADLAIYGLDSLRFDAEEYALPAGESTIAFLNKGSTRHTLIVEGADDEPIGEKLVIGGGGLATGTFELDAGAYTLWCDVPGHNNMRATLTVTG